MKGIMWVLRDLSNGDGAENGAVPKYVWAYRTREAARERARLHKGPAQLGRWSNLGPVEGWPEEDFHLFYEDVGGIAAGEYWQRRSPDRKV